MVIIVSIAILAMSIATVLFVAGPSLKDKGGCNNNCICEDSLVDPSLEGEADRRETRYNCFPPFFNDCCKDENGNIMDCTDNDISPMDYDPTCFPDVATEFDYDNVCSYFESCDSNDCKNPENKGAERCFST